MKKIREILLFSLCVLLFSGSLTAAAADGAPIAENLEIMTYRGISVGGQLKAFDPEGEEVHFRITTEPRKGTLTLEENGDRKSTRLNSSHRLESRMPSSA